MKILYSKSSWEMSNHPLEEFLKRAQADGFDAVEVNLSAQMASPDAILDKIADYGLQLIAQIHTGGKTPQEHKNSLIELFDFAAGYRPLLINSHTSRDIFSFEENLEIFHLGCELSKQSGVLFTNETHRSRPTFSGPMTRQFLEALPEMRITADFSHWCCVHETDLSDQPESLEIAMQRTSHIHARVGYGEGPQVPNPLAPEWQHWTDLHVNWWQQIIDIRKSHNAEFVTITPEFGPPPYMHTEPFTKRPLEDTWSINVQFKDYLKTKLEA